MNPKVVAAAIAGTGIGFGSGFLTESEKLENNGSPFMTQLSGGFKSGIKGGIIGGGAILAPYGVYKALTTPIKIK